ncbi:hypothetical protein Tco_1228888 [Tanacetum coccineum]
MQSYCSHSLRDVGIEKVAVQLHLRSQISKRTSRSFKDGDGDGDGDSQFHLLHNIKVKKEHLLFLGRTDQCDAFDSDVNEAPTTQTMFMANLSSEDPIYDEVGPLYDSNTPFEVQDHDTFVDHMDEYHEVHEMQRDVQHNYVVDSMLSNTSESNIIPKRCR